MKRIFLLACALLLADAAAQTMRATQPKPAPRVNYQRQQPYNSMAKDTTPFNCEQYRYHPHPGMQGFCRDIENMTLQGEARMQGRPAPSTTVISLPPTGSAEAKQLGYACIGGQAMRRLANGWEQVMSRAGGWQRCTGG